MPIAEVEANKVQLVRRSRDDDAKKPVLGACASAATHGLQPGGTTPGANQHHHWAAGAYSRVFFTLRDLLL